MILGLCLLFVAGVTIAAAGLLGEYYADQDERFR